MSTAASFADVAALRQIAREFTEGFNSGDVDRIMRYYGERYVDVNLRNPVQNWAERREYYSSVIRKGVKVNVKPAEIVVEGEFGFVRGSIEVTLPDGKQSELRYLEIARKSDDGSWKMLWGMDGPVQEYEPTR
jgi:ketosteroid isomerase-like protein